MNTTDRTSSHGVAAELLVGAFIELAQSRDTGEISVSDICRRAGVSRTTFYVHYSDIFELADRARRSLEQNQPIPESGEILGLLQHISNNRRFYRIYYRLSGEEYDKCKAGRGYRAVFFSAGFNAVVKMWLESGCAEPPEDILEALGG